MFIRRYFSLLYEISVFFCKSNFKRGNYITKRYIIIGNICNKQVNMVRHHDSIIEFNSLIFFQDFINCFCEYFLNFRNYRNESIFRYFSECMIPLVCIFYCIILFYQYQRRGIIFYVGVFGDILYRHNVVGGVVYCTHMIYGGRTHSACRYGCV